MTTETTNNGLTRNFSNITVDEIRQSDYSKTINGVEVPVFQAQIRQEVTTEYPAARFGNSLNEGLFNQADFGVENSKYTSTRVNWIPVPEGTTKEQVEALLAKNPEARIYAIYSNNVQDVMTDEQRYAVKSETTELSVFEEKLRIKTRDGEELPGFDEEGKAQYRQYGFSKTATADIDYRTYKGANSNQQVAILEGVTADEKAATAVKSTVGDNQEVI